MRSKRHNPLHSLIIAALVGVLLIACGSPTSPGGPVPLARAYAHNDYEHERPLHDALNHGFTSVEADVHLVDGQLLVAHDEEDVQEDRTLQALYLDPLRKCAQQNDGWVYPDGAQVTLLVDVKTEAQATYEVLRQVLRGYEDVLTVFGPDGRRDGAVVVIISGNRPREMMAGEELRYKAYDGRLEDLESGEAATFIPLISDKWTDHFFWRGRGAMPESERQKLQAIVETAHQHGRRVRFWDTPDDPSPAREAVWRALVQADVDMINTDDLVGLQQFLLAYGQQHGD
jgi:hypothetical protein